MGQTEDLHFFADNGPMAVVSSGVQRLFFDLSKTLRHDLRGAVQL